MVEKNFSRKDAKAQRGDALRLGVFARKIFYLVIRMLTLGPICKDEGERFAKVLEGIVFYEKPLHREIVGFFDCVATGIGGEENERHTFPSQRVIRINLLSQFQSVKFG